MLTVAHAKHVDKPNYDRLKPAGASMLELLIIVDCFQAKQATFGRWLVYFTSFLRVSFCSTMTIGSDSSFA